MRKLLGQTLFTKQVFGAVAATILAVTAVAGPVAAKADRLSPLPDGEGWWIAGPDVGDEVAGSSGKATVNKNGAHVTVRARGLQSGQAFTAWLVFFNDGPECIDPEADPTPTNCGPGDLGAGNGGIVFLDGKVVGGSGKATFSGRIKVGDVATHGPSAGAVAYEPVSPDFHIVVRSHGPKVPSEMPGQINSLNGGCDVEVGPGPQNGNPATQEDIPEAVGECGDVQLFVFETDPAGA